MGSDSSSHTDSDEVESERIARVPLSRRQLLGATGAVSVFGLAGCAGGGGTQETTQPATTDPTTTTTDGSEPTETTQTTNEKRGGSLTVAQVKAPPDWDPVRQLGGPAAIIGQLFFSSLYEYTSEPQLVPGDLADGMPEVERDAQRYIVSIVDGAQFHNGDPVTAEDVAYSYRAPIEEETRWATTLSMVDSIEVVDDTTVQFDLSFSYGPFPGALGQLSVVPKAVREDDRETFATENPVGSGPFVFEDWTQGEFTRLTRWDDYWGEKKPYLDAVEFIPVVEPTTRVTNFRQGDSDLMQGIPPKLYSTVEGLENSRILETPALNYYYMTFNLNEGQTTKLDVRNAISYCFDMDRVVEQFVQPAGVRQYQPLPIPTAEAWDMPVEEFEGMAHGKDIDQAKTLFEQADVPSDWTCTLLSPPDDKRENMLISVANGIQEAGYDAEVQRLEWGTFLERFASGNADDYQAYALGWSVSPDPDYQMYAMYHESGAGSNQGHYWADQDVMDMIERSRRTTDRDERRQLYIDIQTEIIEQKVQIPAYNLKETWAAKSYVKDLPVNPVSTENPMLLSSESNVWLDE